MQPLTLAHTGGLSTDDLREFPVRAIRYTASGMGEVRHNRLEGD